MSPIISRAGVEAGQSFLGWSQKNALERAVSTLHYKEFKEVKMEGKPSRHKILAEIKDRKTADCNRRVECSNYNTGRSG